MARDPLLELADRHLIRYVPGFAPFLIERASGSWLWDRDGNPTSGPFAATCCLRKGSGPSWDTR